MNICIFCIRYKHKLYTDDMSNENIIKNIKIIIEIAFVSIHGFFESLPEHIYFNLLTYFNFLNYSYDKNSAKSSKGLRQKSGSIIVCSFENSGKSCD